MDKQFIKCEKVAFNLDHVFSVEHNTEAESDSDEAVKVVYGCEGNEWAFTYEEGKEMLYAVGLLK